MDRFGSAALGRPCAIQDEEYVFRFQTTSRDSLCCSFDLELPLEVDDEYWDPVTKEWNQPNDKVRC